MQSFTECANGPATGSKCPFPKSNFAYLAEFPPLYVSLLYVGLNPTIPVNEAGTLMLPPISDPIAIGTHLEATSPASPPLLPPQDLSLSQKFNDVPQIKLVV